jgi:uncharacterized protein YndB with AHSA1/START domain
MDTTSKTQSPSLTIRRTFPVSPEKVWRALTDPDGLKRWMAPSDDYAVPVAEADVRVGGRYRIVMRAPDGEEHDVSGVYREVLLNRKLVYTWSWKSTPERESLVTIELRAAGTGTELTVVHQQFHDEETRDLHEQGWNGCLNRLQVHLGS